MISGDDHTLPTFAIVGAQKSASTFLQKQLQSHPDIFLPGGELATFEDPNYADYDPESFSSHFTPGRNVEEIGLKRPSYLHEPAVPERLAEHLPEIRLIVSLRDPINRAISAYFHQVRQNFAPLVDVNQGLEKILKGRWSEKYPRTSQIIEYGKYYQQIERYLKYFDRESLYLTTYRAVTTRSEDVLGSIQDFLKVNPKSFTGLSDSSANVGLYSKPRLLVARLVNRIRFEYFHNGQRMRPMKNIGLLKKITVRGLRNLNRHILQLFETGQPSLQTDVRGELVSYYRDDAERLRSTFDLDVDHWSVFTHAK